MDTTEPITRDDLLSVVKRLHRQHVKQLEEQNELWRSQLDNLQLEVKHLRKRLEEQDKVWTERVIAQRQEYEAVLTRQGEVLVKSLPAQGKGGEDVAELVARYTSLVNEKAEQRLASFEARFEHKLAEHKALEYKSFVQEAHDSALAQITAVLERLVIPPAPPPVVQVNVPEQAPPVVQVTTPQPVVNVEVAAAVPTVTVEPAPILPQFDVHVPPARLTEKEHLYDDYGRPWKTIEREKKEE